MTREQPDILRITLMIAVYSLFVVSTITVGLPYMVRTVLGLRGPSSLLRSTAPV